MSLPKSKKSSDYQPTTAEVAALESFAENLLAEYESELYEAVAKAANDTNVITRNDITRLGPFIDTLMTRTFALGLSAMAIHMHHQAEAEQTSILELQ